VRLLGLRGFVYIELMKTGRELFCVECADAQRRTLPERLAHLAPLLPRRRGAQRGRR